MAPFSIPVPSIVPLRLPVFGGPKSIDTNTKIELLCDTFLDHEIFYTIDGTKPQPYAGIVQGNKTIKYKTPFCLPPGKITIKAIAVNANIHSMCSNVVTKRFEVLRTESPQKVKEKKAKDPKLKKQKVDNGSNKCDEKEQIKDALNNRIVSKSSQNNGENGNCFDEAFIDTLEFEIVNDSLEDDAADQNQFLIGASDDDVSENSDILDEVDDPKSYAIAEDSHLMEEDVISSNRALEQHEQNNAVIIPNGKLSAINLQNVETQFCCLKCDMALQQCFSCKRMNAVSSKFCTECGIQLTQVCYSCKEHNPSVATFCQYCGKKLSNATEDKQDACLKVDSCIMAKPQLRHASVQRLPVMITKSTQTTREGTPVKKTSPKFDMKRMPHQSPGRGYWHQQLDYICNHLKSHAYNNVEFRKTISEPILCDFKSAHITKDENSVTVTVAFSPFLVGKSNVHESEQIKSKGSS